MKYIYLSKYVPYRNVGLLESQVLQNSPKIARETEGWGLGIMCHLWFYDTLRIDYFIVFSLINCTRTTEKSITNLLSSTSSSSLQSWRQGLVIVLLTTVLLSRNSRAMFFVSDVRWTFLLFTGKQKTYPKNIPQYRHK